MMSNNANYVIDKYGVKREVSPSFWLYIPGTTECISCPICRACKHEYFTGSALVCDLYPTGREPVRNGRYFLCSGYEADTSSPDYKMVQREIEEAKKSK